MDHHPTPPFPEDPPGPDPDPGFYQRAFQRMPRWIALVAIVALPFVWWHGGALWSASFLVGAIGGYWNYVAVCRVADRLAQTVERNGAARRPTLRALLRLLFIAVAVFVIIRFTRIHLVAAFIGLFTPVAAVVVEILYELGLSRDKP
jgi:dipeptide/tripeptide permease